MHYSVEKLWQARLNILRGQDYSCPADMSLFFYEYARNVTPIDSPLPERIGFEQELLPKVRGSVLACSTFGADSALMRHLLPNLDILHIQEKGWRPIPPLHKREFQIGLQALSDGYSCVYIGITDFDEPTPASEVGDPYQFEYTQKFVDLWNDYLPTKLIYPLRYLSRVDVYKRLLSYGQDLNSLSPCNKGGTYCGNCIKCFVHYVLVKTLTRNSRLPPPTKDIEDKTRAEWLHKTDYLDVKKCIRQLGLGDGPNFVIP